MYDGTGDLDEHVDTFDLLMQYRNATNDVECKILPLSLSKTTLSWFRDLKHDSIYSWEQLVRVFSAHFTASGMKLKFADVLKAVKQGENETLRDYIERFNKEANNVRELGDDIRLLFMRHGLHKKSLFQIDVDIRRPRSLEDFLRRAQRFIDYEEDDLAAEKAIQESAPAKGAEKGNAYKKESAGTFRERRPQFTEYTKLKEVKSKNLAECENTELIDRKWPAPLVQRENTDKKKYCRYYRSHRHEIN